MEGVRAEALGQTKLAFDDLVNQFNAAQEEAGECPDHTILRCYSQQLARAIVPMRFFLI